MPNCLGNEVESGCVVYTGPDIASLGIKNGDPLDSVLGKIVSYQTPVLPESTVPTTDTIITKAGIRNTGSLCASSIVKRDFGYSLATNSGGTTLTYSLVEIISSLPSGYELAASRVYANGQPVQGITTFFDAKSIATTLSIPVQRYPVTVDFLLRLTSPCGQIDMSYTLNLMNPTITGAFRASLDARDLNPTSGEVTLTTQLNNLEAKVQKMEGQIQDNLVASSAIAAQDMIVSDVKSKVDDSSSLPVIYTKDGASAESQLSQLATDLYSEINTLKSTIASQKLELSSVKSQLNAT